MISELDPNDWAVKLLQPLTNLNARGCLCLLLLYEDIILTQRLLQGAMRRLL